MIGRRWHGLVPNDKAEAYRAHMIRVAIPDYRRTNGNRGAWCFTRVEDDHTYFEMLTLWSDVEAIKRFAGNDYSIPKYYDFDKEYLVEFENRVLHFDVVDA